MLLLVSTASAAAADCVDTDCEGTADWPPALDSLTNGGRCATTPPCDPEADAALSLQDWQWVLETTATDCPKVVGLTDPRARVGNVVVRPVGARLVGTCVVGRSGDVIGAMHEGVLALCQSSKEAFGVVAHRSLVVEVRPGGRGEAFVPLRHLPRLLTGRSRCEIQIRVEMRAPETPPVAAAP